MKHVVIGGTGLLGSAIVRATDGISVSSKDFDATSQQKTWQWFYENKSLITGSTVYICSGLVAGIVGQKNDMFLYANSMMALNILNTLTFYKPEKVVYYSSSCVYPRDLDDFQEDDIMKGVCEPSNEGYAIGKIVGQKYCEMINQSLGEKKYLTVVPPNLYGDNDNWDLDTCHVHTALTQKIAFAKLAGTDLKLMGHGNIRREFMRTDDVADATLFLLENNTEFDSVNVGMGTDISLYKLVEELSSRIGYEGNVEFTGDLPGKIAKLLDNTRISNMGWKPKYSYENMYDYLTHCTS